MWVHRSDILAPLTQLTSSETQWKWTDVEQQAFNKMKNIKKMKNRNCLEII